MNLEHYKQQLAWSDTLGLGYLQPDSVTEEIYDEEYFKKYFNYEDTPIGKALNQARIELVEKYVPSEEVLDIGIGSGQFVRGAGCHGTDINPHAIEYLKSIDRHAVIDDQNQWEWVTMWDVLEHIENPHSILQNVQKGIVLSMPIYNDKNHCLSSKHFRPNEHIWYFTVHGLINWMQNFGFKCLEFNRVESDIGREDIGSFVFIRA